ncbi:MAG TPA: NAD(P)H-dependent oxidoreductase, partial [Saprospiraceae bacterium]|nr:NAD(P)H-dependent oxidoreductase [Saprospiraceae bacterium]
MADPQTDRRNEPLRMLLFSASLRKDSLNTRLAKLTAGILENLKVQVDFARMEEFDCPSFNQDLESNDNHPPGAVEFRKRILA